MKVIGIDLSLTGTGISDGTTTWTVGTKGSKGASVLERKSRLTMMLGLIMSEPITGQRTDLVVIEGPAFASSSGQMWDRAGLWWLLTHHLINCGIAVAEVAPACLKKYATGKGNAGKPQMLEATIRRMPDVEHGADDNRVDALWLAAMGLDHCGLAITEMPALNRTALGAVRWPL